MNGHLLILLPLAQLAIFVSTCGAIAGEVPQAETLLRQALAADESADHSQRDQLLHKALQVNPDYQLARWYLGQVHFDGQWKSVDAVSQQTANNSSWQEYQDRLSEVGGDLESQAELARWCAKQGLTYQSKWHWWHVLNSNPDHREALANLGVRWYEGMLLSDQQIKLYQQEEKLAKTAYKKYSQEFESWLRQASLGTAADRAATIRKVSEVRELAAVPALMDAVFYDAKSEKLVRDKLRADTDHFFEQLRVAVVTSLSEIRDNDATRTLLQLALDWPEAEIAAAAAKALQYRDKMHYVPQLMGQLAPPLELATSTRVAPNGKITVSHDIAEEGPLAKNELKRSSQFYTREDVYVQRRRVAAGGGPLRPITPVVARKGFFYRNPDWAYFTRVDHARDRRNAAIDTASTAQSVQVENANRRERNKRVEYVLAIATGEDHGEEPAKWWDAWKQYNELYTPEELPVEQTVQQFDYTDYSIQPVRMTSCFVAGTPVWTEAGLVAIEKIQVGDIVLSQDPATGELDYRPVIQTTVRPPTGTVKLGIGEEEIVATRGHRFWVTGKGWNMAKFLKPGVQLWSLAGEVNLDMAEPSKVYEAYNLEVGQFHTYFVGRSKLLVHDNTCPQPITRSLPGLEDTP